MGESLKRDLAEFLDGYLADRVPKRSRLARFRKVFMWAASVVGGALLLSHSIPAVNQVVAAVGCAVRYETAPGRVQVPVRLWSPYGGTTMTSYDPADRAFTIQPPQQLMNDEEWFGVSFPYTRTCDYSMSFEASLTAPLSSANPGWGYAFGARGTVLNGWPWAATIQFDPALGGLRTVILPNGANAPGYNAEPFDDVNGFGTFNRWTVSVKGNQMYASLNGADYPPVTLQRYAAGDILFRVWNGRLTVRNLTITRLPNSLASWTSSFMSSVSLLWKVPLWSRLNL